MSTDERDRSKITTRVDTGGDAFVPPSRLAREACIVVIYGPDLGRRAPLGQSPFAIGRSPRSDLPIDQESVSRHHARIVYGDPTYVVCDLESTNGTYVNDERVQESALNDGDQIKIGQSILKFMSGANVDGAYHEEIHRLMTVDNLTQTHNKRYFGEALQREYMRATRYKRALSLVAFDLDHFKAINDAHGHVVGDHVLRQVAAAVKERLRAQDIFARVGGEEFCVLLPEVDAAGARVTAEKIRAIVHALTIPYEDKRITCTISLGIAVASSEVADATGLHQVADAALYRAKAAGRNRTEG